MVALPSLMKPLLYCSVLKAVITRQAGLEVAHLCTAMLLCTYLGVPPFVAMTLIKVVLIVNSVSY